MHGVLREVTEITSDQNMWLFKAIVIEGVRIHCYGVFIGLRQSCGRKGGRERGRGKLTEKQENKRRN